MFAIQPEKKTTYLSKKHHHMNNTQNKLRIATNRNYLKQR